MRDKTYSPYVKMLRIRKESDNEFVTLSAYGKIIKMNTISKKILEYCNGKNTIDEIATFICNEYKAPKDCVIKDIFILLDKMKLCGMVQNVRNI